MSDTTRKVAIVGAGAVGSTFCYTLAQSGLADEIVLIDKNESLAEGHVLDLVHGKAFYPTVSIRVGTKADYADAQIIVITAGMAQKPGETRLQLLHKNAAIMRQIVDDIVSVNSTGILLVASNPVDVLTYVAQTQAGYTKGRVIGSGTVLDSARFKHLLSDHCGIDIHNVHAYILGEHGDSEFAAWSMTHIAGMSIEHYCPICHRCGDNASERNQIEKEVREAAYRIIEYKGATYYAISMALLRITEAILRGQRSVLTVSIPLDGEYGLHDVSISVPCIVSKNGVERIIESNLTEKERMALQKSADTLKATISQLDE